MFSPAQAGGGAFGMPLWFVTCLLPLAIGVFGTLGVLAFIGRKPVVDRSSEINDYQSLLSKRDVELRDRETELGNLRSQMKHVEEDYNAIRGDRDRLDASLKAAEKRSADSNAHVLALQTDLSAANTAKLKFEQDLKRRDSDFAAASAKLTGALGDFDKAKLTTAAQIAALTAGAATAAAAIKGRDSKIGELEGKIKGLEADVALKTTLAKEVDDYKLRLGKLEGAIKEGADVKLKADKELADLRTQLTTAKSEGDKAKTAAAAELAALTAGAATAAAALKDKDTKIGELEARLKTLEADVAARAKEASDFRTRFEKADTDLKATVGLKSDWETKLTSRDTELADLRTQLAGVKGDADKAKAAAAAELAALTAGAAAAAVTLKGKDTQIGELEARLKTLEADAAARAKEAADFRMRFEKADTDLKATVGLKGDWDSKLSAKDKELADLRAQLNTAKTAAAAELAALTAGAATAAVTLKNKDARIGELEGRLKTLEADVAARAQEAVDFRTRFEKADTDLKATVGLKGDWDSKLSAKDKELADLRAQLNTAKTAAAAELAALTAGAATAAVTLKNKDARIGELEARLKTLEADAAARAQEAADFRTRFEIADTDLKATVGLKGNWDTQLSAKDKELDDLRARIAKLEADLKTGMDAKARVEADRDLRDRELGDLRTRLAGLQGDVEKTRGIAAAELAALTAGAATAAATLKAKDSRIGDLEKRLAAMESEVGGMRTRREQALADAQGEIASLRANMTKSQSDWESRLLTRESEWKAQLETSTAKLAQTSPLVVDAQATRDSVATAAAKLGLKAVVAACPQHLSDIHGIGTVFEQRLFETGIGTFFEVANMSEEDMTRALQITGEMVKSVDFKAIRADALRLAKETDTQGRTWSGEEPDDFGPIDGIGHTFEKRLYDAGICTYKALLNTPQEEVERIISKGKKLVTKPDIPYWFKQAAELLAKKGGDK